MTNTAFARLRKLDKHMANAKCMIAGMSIRDTADSIGVCAPTAFCLGHRSLTEIEAIQLVKLGGIVEADETNFLESYKAKRGSINVLGREPKVRGIPAKKRGLSKDQNPVLVVRDRGTGNTLSTVIPSTKAVDLGKIIVPVLAVDAG